MHIDTTSRLADIHSMDNPYFTTLMSKAAMVVNYMVDDMPN